MKNRGFVFLLINNDKFIAKIDKDDLNSHTYVRFILFSRLLDDQTVNFFLNFVIL
jgi:hypothetical protein